MLSIRPQLLLAFLISTAFAGVVMADVLPIAGSYGNKDGCAYAKSGQSTGSENFFLLTRESVTTAFSQCTFSDIKATPKNGFTVTAICEEEGNTDELAPFEIVIEPVGKDSYALKLDDGQTWGPLALCK